MPCMFEPIAQGVFSSCKASEAGWSESARNGPIKIKKHTYFISITCTVVNMAGSNLEVPYTSPCTSVVCAGFIPGCQNGHFSTWFLFFRNGWKACFGQNIKLVWKRSLRLQSCLIELQSNSIVDTGRPSRVIWKQLVCWDLSERVWVDDLEWEVVSYCLSVSPGSIY